MVVNIVVYVYQRTHVFDVMKILMSVIFFHRHVEIVQRRLYGEKAILCLRLCC